MGFASICSEEDVIEIANNGLTSSRIKDQVDCLKKNRRIIIMVDREGLKKRRKKRRQIWEIFIGRTRFLLHFLELFFMCVYLILDVIR